MPKEISVVVLAMVAGLATMVPPAMAASGTATFYTPPYTPSACFGNSEEEGTMIAALSEVFWDGGAACGDGVPHPCTGRSVTVKIVDLCPAGCRGTIDLSQEAFAVIADPDAGKINVEYSRIGMA
ncbi:hypothetical protein PVAP13_9NG234900 [Panicum virgatum]|uniref:Expansin-like EG45 domain-containing protein n=1 Tax=Panicum virgatum TaxID=38727 RepID=A0A8T0MKP9_PANVG|nr:hypothetical protein PVAP13_9NG234900 [Panicum virgatum]